MKSMTSLHGDSWAPNPTGSSVPENHNGLRGSAGRGRLIPPSVNAATAESAVVQSLLTFAQPLVVRAAQGESREPTGNVGRWVVGPACVGPNGDGGHERDQPS